jgi:bacteriocin-like protein
MTETHADMDELSIDELNVVSGGDGKPATAAAEVRRVFAT